MKTVKAGTHIVDDKGHLIGTTKYDMDLDHTVYLSDLDMPRGKKGIPPSLRHMALRHAWERMRKAN